MVLTALLVKKDTVINQGGFKGIHASRAEQLTLRLVPYNLY